MSTWTTGLLLALGRWRSMYTYELTALLQRADRDCEELVCDPCTH